MTCDKKATIIAFNLAKKKTQGHWAFKEGSVRAGWIKDFL